MQTIEERSVASLPPIATLNFGARPLPLAEQYGALWAFDCAPDSVPIPPDLGVDEAQRERVTALAQRVEELSRFSLLDPALQDRGWLASRGLEIFLACADLERSAKRDLDGGTSPLISMIERIVATTTRSGNRVLVPAIPWNPESAREFLGNLPGLLEDSFGVEHLCLVRQRHMLHQLKKARILCLGMEQALAQRGHRGTPGITGELEPLADQLALRASALESLISRQIVSFQEVIAANDPAARVEHLRRFCRRPATPFSPYAEVDLAFAILLERTNTPTSAWAKLPAAPSPKLPMPLAQLEQVLLPALAESRTEKIALFGVGMGAAPLFVHLRTGVSVVGIDDDSGVVADGRRRMSQLGTEGVSLVRSLPVEYSYAGCQLVLCGGIAAQQIDGVLDQHLSRIGSAARYCRM